MTETLVLTSRWCWYVMSGGSISLNEKDSMMGFLWAVACGHTFWTFQGLPGTAEHIICIWQDHEDTAMHSRHMMANFLWL